MFSVNIAVICSTLFISLNYVFGEYCSDLQHTDRRNSGVVTRNLCKKIPGKKVSEKKPGNKNYRKKCEISQVLGKNVTGNKVLCFGFLGLFFLK